MSDTHSMLENHRWNAVWWRKDRPDQRVAGQVLLDEQGLRLNGVGPSLSHRRSSQEQPERFQLDGLLSNGKRFTATEAWQANHDFGFSDGPFEPQFHAATLYLNAHLEGVPQVSKTFSDSPVLDPWLAVETIEVSVTPPPQFGLALKMGGPVQLAAAHCDGVGTFELWRNRTFERKHGPVISATATEQGEVYLESPAPRPLDEAVADHKWFHNLLGLLTGVPAPIRHFSFELDPDTRVQVLHTIRTEFREVPSARLHPGRFAAGFRQLDAKLGIERAVQTWFRDRELFRLPLGLLQEALVSTGAVEFRFLALAQALEGFHRRRYPKASKYLSDKAYKPIRKAMTEAIPEGVDPKFRESLTIGLKYANEFSLRQRLEALVGEAPASLQQAFPPSPAEWVGAFVKLRNNLAHLPDKFGGVSKAVEVHYQGLAASLLLQAHLLMGLGLPKDFVGEALKRTNTWDNLKRAGYFSFAGSASPPAEGLPPTKDE